MKEYYVFLGSFGSGKSELAINFALQKALQNPPCTLVDVDVVNPYFRSSERGDLLRQSGIRLISPPYALQKIEIMSLSPEVYSAFAQPDGTVIFDAGGDPVGAVSLGQYYSYFRNIICPTDTISYPGHPAPDFLHSQRTECAALSVFMVINPFRPLAETAKKAYALMEQIQIASRLKVTGLINNANLVNETTAQELKIGYDVVRELSEMTKIPVYATCGTKQVLDDFLSFAETSGLDPSYIGTPIPIDIIMHRTWNKFLKEGL